MALIPKHNRQKFDDIWNNANDFWQDYYESGLYTESFSEEYCKKLYYLLIGRYANNIIANEDVNQFKYKTFTIIFSYAPEWQRKMEIQKTLRELTAEDLVEEGESIVNHANNPSSKPSTKATDPLLFVDDQNYSKRKKAKLDAYTFLDSVLHSDMTPRFLDKFESLFTKFCPPLIDAVFCSEEDEDK